MKKLILLITLLISFSVAKAQCVEASNLQTSWTVPGLNQLYLSWNTVGCTEFLVMPLNFSPVWYGETVASWYGSPWSLGGVAIDTTGLCGTTIQWQIKTYCFTHTGNETLDTTNADKSFSAIQSYFVSCDTSTTPIVFFNNGGHQFKKKKH